MKAAEACAAGQTKKGGAATEKKSTGSVKLIDNRPRRK